MAGWSMIAGDGSSLDCAKTHKNHDPNRICIYLDIQSASESKGQAGNLRCFFDRFLSSLLKELSAQHVFRPLPPMLGNGQCVNLLKLFLIVREKGGHDAVSRNGLWNLVAQESGLGLNVASAVKLVHSKYLGGLERLLGKVVKKEVLESASGVELYRELMGLEEELEGILSEIVDQKKKESTASDLTVNLLAKSADGTKECIENKEVLNLDLPVNLPVGKLTNNINSPAVESVVGKKFVDAEELDSKLNVPVVGITGTDEETEVKTCGGKEDVMSLDTSPVNEDNYGRKRKRDSLLGMVYWVTGVAKNPCDVVIDSLPEASKWKTYGNNELWKQVILVRESLLLKRQVDASASEQSFWQKSQKMHPCMYEDPNGSSYNLRERLKFRQKLFSENMQACSESSSSGTQNDLEKSSSSCRADIGDHVAKKLPQTTYTLTVDSMFENHPRQRIPLGPTFQADVPEWTEPDFESDPKWFGTRIWPLEKPNNNILIERDRIGKGRQDSCGCQITGSIECVRFHIGERRFRVKLELGPAFHYWKFNQMGEEVTLYWTGEEEEKFKTTVKAHKCFSVQILKKSFCNKSREDLVSYYFNVFLLRHRGYQNRFTPNEINSDDESESVEHKAVKSTSIFYSPNKMHTRNT